MQASDSNDKAYDVPETPPLSDEDEQIVKGEKNTNGKENMNDPKASIKLGNIQNENHLKLDAEDPFADNPEKEKERQLLSPTGFYGNTGNELFDLSSPNRKHKIAEECLEPWRYICQTPGKNVRSMMIDCFQKWLKIPAEKITTIKQVVGFLHNASLLIDDIEDDSQLRRGEPVAHQVYGVPLTLNCGCYIYFLAMEKVITMQNAKAVQLFNQELLNLHRGQGLELFWRENTICPTEEQYIGMVQDKTGGLFRLGVGLMQSFSENRTDFTKLVNLLAVYFQVRDDLINLASSNYQQNKSFCEDLSEGKFSFPLLHAIKNSKPGDTRIISILKQRTENVDLKKKVVAMLREEFKSFEYCKSYLNDLFVEIENEIETVGGSEQLMELMQKLRVEVDQCEC